MRGDCSRVALGSADPIPRSCPAAESGHSQGQIAVRGCGKVARRANHFRFSEFVSILKIKNISLLPKAKSGAYLSPSRPNQRGARDRHERGTGMRWTQKLRLTSVA